MQWRAAEWLFIGLNCVQKQVVGDERYVLIFLHLLTVSLHPLSLRGSRMWSSEVWFPKSCFCPFKILTGEFSTGTLLLSILSKIVTLCLSPEILIPLPCFISLLRESLPNTLCIYSLISFIVCLPSLERQLHEGRGSCLFCSLLCLLYLTQPWTTPTLPTPKYTCLLLLWLWFC